MKKVIFYLIIFLVNSVKAHATTGAELYNWCKPAVHEEENTEEAIRCFLYLRGYWDGATASSIEVYKRFGLSHKGDIGQQPVLCIPDNANLNQIRLMYINFAEKHPEKLSNDAISVLANALISAFCAK